MPAVRIAAAVLIAGAVAIGTAAGGVVPAAAHIGCGAVLTSDTTLTADLLECPGDGLVIGADDITIDLAGHRVQGSILSTDDRDQVGIDNTAGHDRVTVRGGVVEDFAGGVHAIDAEGMRVLGVHFGFSGDDAVLLEGEASGAIVAGNSVTGTNGYGISLRGAAASVTRNAVISGNTVAGTLVAGIAVRGGTVVNARIEGNEVSRTSASEGWSAGIVVGHGAGKVQGAVVRGNHLHDNFGGGISIGRHADGSTVRHNRLVDNSDVAIKVAGDGTAVSGNAVSTAAVAITNVGVQVEPTATGSTVGHNDIRSAQLAGVADRGRDSRIRRNRIDGAQPGADWWGGGFGGIVVTDEAAGAWVTDNDVVRQDQRGISIEGRGIAVARNHVSRMRYDDAVHVDTDAVDVSVSGNRVSQAGGDGIDVQSATTTVSRNVALDNADLGIVVVPGVTDGGGNRAARNGDPRQCAGIVCLTAP